MGIFDKLIRTLSGDSTPKRTARPLPASATPSAQSNFDAATGMVEIRYLNYRGEQKTFFGDGRTVRPRGDRINIQVAPNGVRISLKKASIQNWSEVSSRLAFEALPDSNERRILDYHLKRHTTSPRFEEARRKFPNYDIS